MLRYDRKIGSPPLPIMLPFDPWPEQQLALTFDELGATAVPDQPPSET